MTGARSCDAEHEACRRNDTVVRTEHGGAQPAYAVGAVPFRMSASRSHRDRPLESRSAMRRSDGGGELLRQRSSGVTQERAPPRSKFEELPTQGRQLVLGRVIDDVIGDDACGSLWPVLLGIVPEVGQGGSRAGHQHRVDALEVATNLREELVLRSNFGAVLRGRMHMRVHVKGSHRTRIDLQDVRVMVVDPDDCMGRRCDGCAHESTPAALANSANAVIALALYINEGPPPM